MTTIIAFHFPHKAASMFAFQLLASISNRTGLPLFSQNNTPQNHDQIANCERLEARTVLRGPVRNFTVAIDPGDYRFVTPQFLLDRTRYRAVCQTRDILDLIVSQYFSQGWIHAVPESGMPLRADLQAGRISMYDYAILEFEGRTGFSPASILKRMSDLRDLCNQHPAKDVLVLSYEEMMLDYDRWSARLGAFLEIDVPAIGSVLAHCRPGYREPTEVAEFFLEPLDYVQKYGHTFAHVRSPHPGDHRRFLTRNEIRRLRDQAGKVLNLPSQILTVG